MIRISRSAVPEGVQSLEETIFIALLLILQSLEETIYIALLFILHNGETKLNYNVRSSELLIF